MPRNPDRAKLIDRAQALCIYAAVREGYSHAALQMALLGCERQPVRAYRCLKALVNSLPPHER